MPYAARGSALRSRASTGSIWLVKRGASSAWGHGVVGYWRVAMCKNHLCHAAECTMEGDLMTPHSEIMSFPIPILPFKHMAADECEP